MSEKGKEIVLSKTVHRDLKNNEFVTENDWLKPSFVFPKDLFDNEKEILLLIDKAISQTNGNLSRAARLLGVPREHSLPLTKKK